MKTITSIHTLQKVLRKARKQNKTIGFVPTMGALHEGHLSLIRSARRENELVVVSIFVNPAQFGPSEDFRKYPRDLKLDSKLCAKEKTDIIFFPSAREIYPSGYRTFVTVEGLSGLLCGRSRPGHFRGVATVVAKLLNIVGPSNAYFGQKDAQQAIIIKKLVRDLDMPVRIRVMPTVREKDGLAMSSRNIYLNAAERKEALALHQSLELAKSLVKKGVKDSAKIIEEMKRLIKSKKSARIDYVSIVALKDLEPVRKINGPCLIAEAVWIGKTRLIDNIIIGS